MHHPRASSEQTRTTNWMDHKMYVVLLMLTCLAPLVAAVVQADCQAGAYFHTPTTRCNTCAAGTFSTDGSAACSNCTEPGTMSLGAEPSCTPCPAGYACTFDSYVECLAGTYAAEGQMECFPCESGYFSLDQASECTLCTQACADGSILTSGCTLTDDIQCSETSEVHPPNIVVDGTSHNTSFINAAGHRYFSFLESGTIQFSADTIISIMVVGGGGAGGPGVAGAGGGGGIVYIPSAIAKKEVIYRAVVGAGGVKNTGGTVDTEVHTPGSTSWFSDISAGGGGAGGGHYTENSGTTSSTSYAGMLRRSPTGGGSGGGATGGNLVADISLVAGGSANVNSGTGSFQGRMFGSPGGAAYGGLSSAGGGGAAMRGPSAPHRDGVNSFGAAGGDGKLIDMDGRKQYWAGGGAGGFTGAVSGQREGGKGGGGRGGGGEWGHAYYAPLDGLPNTGGGGGGGNLNYATAAGVGGSGIVVVRILGLAPCVCGNVKRVCGNV
jgi:hypothetical protein